MMTHPDSDGIAELLEGAHRTMLTGAQRWLETVNRRRQDQAQIAKRLAERTTQTDLAHQQIAAGYQQRATPHGDQAVGTDAMASISPTEAIPHGDTENLYEVLNLATPDQWYRAAIQFQYETSPSGLEHHRGGAALNGPADVLKNWASERGQADRAVGAADAPFDEAYWRRWAILEATDQQLDAAHEQATREIASRHPNPTTKAAHRKYLEQRLRNLQTDVVETAKAAHQSALANQKASADASRILAAPLEAGPAPSQAEVDVEARSLHDSHQFRFARAENLGRRDYEPDIAQAALINDLTFGTAASEATTATITAKKPAGTARMAHRGIFREKSGTGR